jgi:hypothetical protein
MEALELATELFEPQHGIGQSMALATDAIWQSRLNANACKTLQMHVAGMSRVEGSITVLEHAEKHRRGRGGDATASFSGDKFLRIAAHCFNPMWTLSAVIVMLCAGGAPPATIGRAGSASEVWDVADQNECERWRAGSRNGERWATDHGRRRTKVRFATSVGAQQR